MVGLKWQASFSRNNGDKVSGLGKRTKSLFKNIGAQWIRTLIFIAVGLFVPPLMNHFLGKGTYGAWSLIMSTTGFIKLLALGVPIATVRAIAAAKDEEEVNQVVGTSKKIFMLIGVIALFVGTALYFFFEQAYLTPHIVDGVLESKIAAKDAWAARLAFGLVVGHVALTFVMQLPYTILAGKQQFVAQNKIMIFVLLIRVSMIVSVLAINASIILLAIVEIITLVFEFILPWRSVKKRYPELRFQIRDYNKSSMKTIFNFGGYIVLLHIGMRLCFETDALVIGWGMNSQSVTDYNQSNAFIIHLIQLMMGVGGVMMPMATKLQKEEKFQELEQIFYKWSKITFSLALLVGIYLLVLGPEFVAWWMHDVSYFEPAKQVVPALMLSCFVFLPIRAVTLPMLLGLGKVKFPAWLFLGIGILNIGISLALVRPLGLFGVALGTAIPNVIYAVIVLVYACHQIDCRLIDYVRYVVPKCFLGSIPIVAGLFWIRATYAPRSLAELMISGIGMVVIFVIMWIGFVYRKDPLVDINGPLKSLLKKVSR